MASKSPKTAAVAYASDDQIVAFGKGDTLVMDASDETVAAGQTRARVLEATFRRCAKLYSLPNLHAKVLALGNTAVIGSSNLSANSANVLAEAAWVTDQFAEVQESRAVIQRLLLAQFPSTRRSLTAFLASESVPDLAGLVIDCDTLWCGDERVWLARIDTPEKHAAGFQEAKDAMRLLIEGEEVRCLVARREKYGRLLGECSTGETPSLSDAMLGLGLAERYRGK